MATRYIIAFAPFANWSTALSIGVGELCLWLEIPILIRSNYELACEGFCGVLVIQGSAETEGGPLGVGVGIWTYSLERTLSGLYGTRLAPIKPPYIFFSFIEAKKASRNAQRNALLLTCVTCTRIRSSIWRPYAFFIGPNILRLVAGGNGRNTKACKVYQCCVAVEFEYGRAVARGRRHAVCLSKCLIQSRPTSLVVQPLPVVVQ